MLDLLAVRLSELRDDVGKVKRVADLAESRHSRLDGLRGIRKEVWDGLLDARRMILDFRRSGDAPELDLLGDLESLLMDLDRKVSQAGVMLDQLDGSMIRLMNTDTMSARCNAIISEVDQVEAGLRAGTLERTAAWVTVDDLTDTTVRRLFADYVDLLGGLTLRDTGLDDRVSELTDRLLEELTVPLRAVPARPADLVGDTSVGDLVMLWFPEWTIWDVPLFGHEAGLAWGHSSPLARGLLGDNPGPDRRGLAADAYAAYALGPAYACAVLLLRMRPGGARGASDVDRAYVILNVLRSMSDDGTGAAMVQLVADCWHGAVIERGADPEPRPPGRARRVRRGRVRDPAQHQFVPRFRLGAMGDRGGRAAQSAERRQRRRRRSHRARAAQRRVGGPADVDRPARRVRGAGDRRCRAGAVGPAQDGVAPRAPARPAGAGTTVEPDGRLPPPVPGAVTPVPFELLTQAWAAYHAGDFATARQRADEAGGQDDPATQGVALTLRGLCEVRVHGADGALFAAAADRFAAAQRPDGRRHVAAYGIALALSGQLAAAEPPLRRALMLELAGPDVWRCLGRVLAGRGDRTAARRTVAAAARAFPGDWLVAFDRAELVTGDRATVAEAWATAGALSFAAGRADVAVAAYSRAVDRTPKDLHLLLEKAKACAAAGAVDELDATLDRAIAIAPDNAEFVPLMVQVADWAFGVAPDTAITLLQRAIEHEPEHARAHALLGSARRTLGDDAAATAEYDRAIALDPDDAYPLGNRGQLRLGQGRHEDAIADLERASGLQPDTGWIRFSAGEAYYLRAQDNPSDADIDRALAHLGAALAIEPGNPAALRLIGYAHWLRRATDPTAAMDALRVARAANPDDPHLAYELGLLLYDAAAYEEALACAEQAHAGLPDAPLVRLLRGQLFRATGEPERAIEDLEVAVRAQPDLGEAHAALGEAYRVAGRLDDALAALTAAIDVQPEDGWSLASRGATREALGDVAGALDDLRRSIGRGAEPGFAVWWLCEALRASVDTDDLVAEVGAVAARFPDDPDVQEVYADALHGARRHADAVATAERGLTGRPDHVGLLRSLAWAQSALGEQARAVETLERAVSVQPDVTTLSDLATIVARGDDVAAALGAIDRALAVERTSGLLRLRAEVFAGLAEWRPAVEAARAAVAVEPVEPWAHWELGRALRYLDGGRPEEALAAFRALREQEPANPMGPQGTGDVLWTIGRRAEAEVDYRAAIALYEAFGEEESWTRHGVGWCLHRLGRYVEAADSYLLALPISDERSALLFDIGLNWLADGEGVRAADAYAQGFAVLPTMPATRAPATLAVAGEDLRATVAAGVVAESPQVADLRDQLAKERAVARERIYLPDRPYSILTALAIRATWAGVRSKVVGVQQPTGRGGG